MGAVGERSTERQLSTRNISVVFFLSASDPCSPSYLISFSTVRGDTNIDNYYARRHNQNFKELEDGNAERSVAI